MYNYTTTTYLGYTIHIVTAKADSNQNVQLSVMASQYSPTAKQLAINWHDYNLEAAGWIRKAVINGGLFFTESNIHYANGIERAYGVTNENDDSSLAQVMAFAHDFADSNSVVLNTQEIISSAITNYRGAITGAFGLLREGQVDQGNTSLHGNYSSKSGRSIIGSKEDGTIYFMSVAGVTGSSGLTGAECLSLVQTFNLYNAIAMDGGGSVSLVYEDEWKIQTTRTIKNAVGIYVKDIPETPDPIVPPGVTAELPAPKKGTSSVSRMYLGANKVKKIVRIDPANNSEIVAFRDTIISTNFPQEFGTSYSQSGNTFTATNTYLDRLEVSGYESGYLPTYALSSNGWNAAVSYNMLPWTWTFKLKNCRAAVQGFTLHGWGQNDYPYNTPKSFIIQGSDSAGVNWVTLYDTTTFPSTWGGDSMYWGIADQYSYSVQQSTGGADPILGWGPNGPQTVTSMSNNNLYFTQIRITWRVNQDNNANNPDLRKYWTAAYTGYDWKKANRLGIDNFTFNVKIQPL